MGSAIIGHEVLAGRRALIELGRRRLMLSDPVELRGWGNGEVIRKDARRNDSGAWAAHKS